VIDVFIGTLKDNIQNEFHLWEPKSLENVFKVARKVERKIIETRMSTSHNYKYGSVFFIASHNLQGSHHNNQRKK